MVSTEYVWVFVSGAILAFFVMMIFAVLYTKTNEPKEEKKGKNKGGKRGAVEQAKTKGKKALARLVVVDRKLSAKAAPVPATTQKVHAPVVSEVEKEVTPVVVKSSPTPATKPAPGKKQQQQVKVALPAKQQQQPAPKKVVPVVVEEPEKKVEVATKEEAPSKKQQQKKKAQRAKTAKKKAQQQALKEEQEEIDFAVSLSSRATNPTKTSEAELLNAYEDIDEFFASDWYVNEDKQREFDATKKRLEEAEIELDDQSQQWC